MTYTGRTPKVTLNANFERQIKGFNRDSIACNNETDFFCVGVMYPGEYDDCDVTLECISTPGKLEKYAWPRWESNLRPLEY